MSKGFKYIVIAIFVELQVILILLFFYSNKISNLDNKIRNTNIFISEIFRNKKIEELTIIDKDDIIIGAENAPSTIIYYSKYDCPVCKNFYNTTYQKLKEDYIDKGLVRFVYRFLINPQNDLAAQSVLAGKFLYDNNSFEIYNDGIYSLNNNEFDSLAIINLVNKINGGAIDYDDFDSAYYKQIIKLKTTQALSIGITKTPTFIINGELLEGNRSYENISTKLNSSIK
ncbi:MAG: DsbA family protein [Cyclobacteriaceae bacterium]|nr:DsbA family protein [Cyclobacteriaceae bacterium]